MVIEVTIGDSLQQVALLELYRRVFICCTEVGQRPSDFWSIRCTSNGDGELFSALVSMAVVDLSGPSESECVAVFQPIEVSGLRIEGPVDGLLSAIGLESCVVKGDGGCSDEV